MATKSELVQYVPFWKELKDQGLGTRKIADKHNKIFDKKASSTTILRLLNPEYADLDRKKIRERNQKYNSIVRENIDEIVEKLKSGEPPEEIAKDYEIAPFKLRPLKKVLEDVDALEGPVNNWPPAFKGVQFIFGSANKTREYFGIPTRAAIRTGAVKKISEYILEKGGAVPLFEIQRDLKEEEFHISYNLYRIKEVKVLEIEGLNTSVIYFEGFEEKAEILKEEIIESRILELLSEVKKERKVTEKIMGKYGRIIIYFFDGSYKRVREVAFGIEEEDQEIKKVLDLDIKEIDSLLTKFYRVVAKEEKKYGWGYRFKPQVMGEFRLSEKDIDNYLRKKGYELDTNSRRKLINELKSECGWTGNVVENYMPGKI